MNYNQNELVGQYSSFAVAIETVLFAISLVIGLISRTSFGPTMGYAVCIFLAVSTVIMMASFYMRTEGDHKVFALLGLVASILYAPFVMETYFVQLAVVATNPLKHPLEVLRLLTFVPGSTTFALDMFGYTFLCFSTLAAAFAIREVADRGLQILCFVHGALAVPTVAAPLMSTMYRSASDNANDTGSWVLLFWCALFTPIAILFYSHFRRGKVEGKNSQGPAVSKHRTTVRTGRSRPTKSLKPTP